MKPLPLLALSVFLAILPSPTSAAHLLPNVVIILCDDLGYADIGPFGCNRYTTPNLERLAREGRSFTNFHVSEAICSASRASLLTGC